MQPHARWPRLAFMLLASAYRFLEPFIGGARSSLRGGTPTTGLRRPDSPAFVRDSSCRRMGQGPRVSSYRIGTTPLRDHFLTQHAEIRTSHDMIMKS